MVLYHTHSIKNFHFTPLHFASLPIFQFMQNPFLLRKF